MTPEQIDELLGRMKPDGVNAVCCGVNCNEPLIRLVLVEVDKHADIALKPKTDPCEVAFQAWRAKYGSCGVDGQYLVDNGKAMMTEGEARLPFRAAWDAAKEPREITAEIDAAMRDPRWDQEWNLDYDGTRFNVWEPHQWCVATGTTTLEAVRAALATIKGETTDG